MIFGETEALSHGASAYRVERPGAESATNPRYATKYLLE